MQLLEGQAVGKKTPMESVRGGGRLVAKKAGGALAGWLQNKIGAAAEL